jgi:hypothetical protein
MRDGYVVRVSSVAPGQRAKVGHVAPLVWFQRQGRRTVRPRIEARRSAAVEQKGSAALKHAVKHQRLEGAAYVRRGARRGR